MGEFIMDYLATIRKALIPVAVGVILTVLGAAGVTQDMTVSDALTFLVTALLVYATPNKKTT